MLSSSDTCISEGKLHCWKTIQTLSFCFHAEELGYIFKLQSGCLKEMKFFSVSVIMVNKERNETGTKLQET